MPLLEMILEAGESIVSTHGELSWMSANVQMTESTSTGGQKGLMGPLEAGHRRRRDLSDQIRGPGVARWCVGAKLPGTIFPVDHCTSRAMYVPGMGGCVGPTASSTVRREQHRSAGYATAARALAYSQRLEGEGQAWIKL